MAMKMALHILKSGVVLDRMAFIGYGTNEMSDTITAITKEGKPLLVVESAEKFFTVDNLIEMVKDKNGMYNLIAEGLGADGKFQGGLKPAAKAPEGPQEGKVIRAGAGEPNPLDYGFQALSPGWSVGANMSLGPTKIKRKVASQFGDGTKFYMHPAEYQTLWLAASKFWSNQLRAPVNLLVTCSEGRKTAYFHADKITIGNNNIRRFEMEQVAKYRGWAFPIAQAA